jgi:hypothetical protein
LDRSQTRKARLVPADAQVRVGRHDAKVKGDRAGNVCDGGAEEDAERFSAILSAGDGCDDDEIDLHTG